jgi:GntR family transcriptional regulator, phosphonate transport system regulatory protein
VDVVDALDRFADGQPVVVGAHYLPGDRFPGFMDAYAATGSITDAFARYGIEDYFRKSTRVTARLPDAEEMRVLNLPRSRPVLVTESINVDPDGRTIEYGIARFAADRVHLVFEP